MDVSAEDELYDAVARNDLYGVRKNLRRDVNVNTVCTSGLTPLGAAAHLGHVSICETLIDKYKRSLADEPRHDHRSKKLCVERKNVGVFIVRRDADPADLGDGPTPEGMEALEWDPEIRESDATPADESYASLYRWYADILTRTSDLLRAAPRRDLDQLDRYGRAALHYAADRGHCSIVQLLVAAGCDVNQTGPDNVSALHLAASAGHCDVARLLLGAGARADHFTNAKATALHFAAGQGHLRVMQLLLQAGARVDAADAAERTPLARAVSAQQLRAVELLVRQGARANVEDAHGHTPLCEAVWLGSEPLVRALLAAGAKLTQSHHLLHHSVSAGLPHVAALLLAAGSVVNLRDGAGDTPLHLAARAADVAAARLLLDHGAAVNLANAASGATPLCEAVEHVPDAEHARFSQLLEALAARGASLEAASAWEAPLFRALFLRKTELACALVRYGADVDLCDARTHVDALCVARRHADLRALKMLVYAGHRLATGAAAAAADDAADGDAARWLRHARRNPLHLVDLCRIRVRRALGAAAWASIRRLGLPPQLVSFLNLDHVY